jgi:hypothetical protein
MGYNQKELMHSITYLSNGEELVNSTKEYFIRRWSCGGDLVDLYSLVTAEIPRLKE